MICFQKMDRDMDAVSQNSTVTDYTTNTDDDGGKRKVHKKIVYHG